MLDQLINEDAIIITDQGEFPIDKVTKNNTINGFRVHNVIKIPNTLNDMIKIKANTFNVNVPRRDVFVSPNQEIYTLKMEKAENLCNGDTIVEDYTNTCKHVYNILLENEKHELVYSILKASGLMCETLHPHAVTENTKHFFKY